MASPNSELLLIRSEPDSHLSALVIELSQQVQNAMENMLKMTNEIDKNSAGIMEEIDKCKETALERKKALEEEKDRFQTAAYTVLDLLNNREI